MLSRIMKFEKRKLKNGITVLFEKRDLPIICYSVSNPFGGAHETSVIKGVAHLFEHLLFKGTKTRTDEQISKEIEKRGGIINAFTAQEVTTYWFKLPSEHLDSGMDLIHDILKNPIFDKEKIENEKKVVLEEIKIYHDDPERRVYELIESALYEKPFADGITGSEKTVKALTREKIIEIFKEKYSPENFIVTVVGNADINKICTRLEKDFSPLKKKYSPLPIKQKNQDILEERDGINQSKFVLAMHAPLDSKSQDALEILNVYLASGMSSKLSIEIRERRGLAYTVNGRIEREKNYSYYSIYAGTTKEDLQKVKELIIQGFKDINKMTEEELAESKERLVGLRKIAMEESINVMHSLIFLEISTGKAEDFYKYEERIKAIKLEDVKELAKQLISNYSTAIVQPK